jgi:hypothetical protein
MIVQRVPLATEPGIEDIATKFGTGVRSLCEK